MRQGEDRVLSLIDGGESQTVEFKASLTSGRRQDAIQSLVAFANRDGGQVVFGVKDNGSLVGVDIGQRTIEDLANEISAHTYPSLAADIEVVPVGGKKVVVANSVADTPPLIGVYLYSPRAIEPTEPVPTSQLQAFRRVGKTNQRIDFMLLRRTSFSDVRLRLRLMSAYVYSDNRDSGVFTGRVWVEEGSASAHHVTFELSPWDRDATKDCPDLPFPSLKARESPLLRGGFEYEGFTHAVDIRFENVDLRSVPPLVEVKATYRDEHGLVWRARRRSRLKLAKALRYGETTS